MHRLLFLLTVYGAAENECLQLVGSSAELDFEPVTDFFPATALKEFTLEDASSLDTNLLQIHGHRVERATVLEEIELFVAFTEEMFCDSRGLGASLGVELAEIGDGLLADFLPVAYRAHESPVGVGLAVLSNGRVAQVRLSSLLRLLLSKRPTPSSREVGTTSRSRRTRSTTA